MGQPRGLELVELGASRVFFPGLPDLDMVDQAVAAWGRDDDHVLAVTRCWSQPFEGDETRTRVYGVLIDPDGNPAHVRRQCVDVIGVLLSGPVGLEVVVPAEDISTWQSQLFDEAVVLWELEGSQVPPG